MLKDSPPLADVIHFLKMTSCPCDKFFFSACEGAIISHAASYALGRVHTACGVNLALAFDSSLHVHTF